MVRFRIDPTGRARRRVRDLGKNLPGRTMRKLVKATAIEAFRAIVRGSVVDTGRMAGSWHVTIGSPGTDPGLPRTQPGIRAYPSQLSRIAPNVIQSGITGFEVVYFTNNVDYTEAWETGSVPNVGFHPRMPEGMLIFGTRAALAFLSGTRGTTP